MPNLRPHERTIDERHIEQQIARMEHNAAIRKKVGDLAGAAEWTDEAKRLRGQLAEMVAA